DRATGARDRAVARRGGAQGAADGERLPPARKYPRARHGSLRRSLGDRGGQDRRRGACPSGSARDAGSRTPCQPRGVSGSSKGKGAVPAPGDGGSPRSRDRGGGRPDADGDVARARPSRDGARGRGVRAGGATELHAPRPGFKDRQETGGVRMRGRMLGRSKIVERIVSWFIPDTAILGRTEWELARIFVFAHIFGPLIAQPMWIYLYLATPRVSYRLVVMACAICGFWLLPFVLRRTGSIRLSAACSFQLLTAASLFGTYHYGGFSSPFLPWLVVSLMLGL